MPHRDDLADCAAAGGLHVDAEVIAAAVAAERDPLQAPPFVAADWAGGQARLAFGLELRAPEVFPDLPLVGDARGREEFPARQNESFEAAIVQREQVTKIWRERRADSSFERGDVL